MMSKALITTIGLVISLGIIALGTLVVALPLYVQAAGVDSQTATVTNTNAIYQSQVDKLRVEEERIDEITASVSSLRAQIPEVGQYDDVFEVIGKAADASDVTITSITAGQPAVFVPRTGTSDQEAAAATAPATSPSDEGTTAAPAETAAPSASSARQQVDFAIQVAAEDMDDVTRFIDQLRAGPRLLSTVTSLATRSGEGAIEVSLTALAYIESEG